MVRTGGHFAGTTLGDKGEQIKLSRKEQKIIMNIRKERQPHHSTEGDDESDNRQSRTRWTKKRARRIYSRLHRRQASALRQTYRNKDDRDHRNNNSHEKGKKCIICNMNNHHSADECRNLTTAQDVVTQAKSKYSGDQQQSNNHANFGNLQRPILSATNPLNQALTIQRSGHRGVIQRE